MTALLSRVGFLLREVFRFYFARQEHKHLIVFVEGLWARPHLLPVLREYTVRTGKNVAWLTSSMEDRCTPFDIDGIEPFYLGTGIARALVINGLHADLFVTTTPDFGLYQLKRSPLVKRFVYIHHSPASMHSIYNAGAFDDFDTIFCVGPHHMTEALAIARQRSRSAQELIAHGYGKLDDLIAKCRDLSEPLERSVLLAPTWGDQAILEKFGEELIGALIEKGYRTTVRPHPMTIRRHPALIKRIQAHHAANPLFYLDTNSASSESLSSANLLITDWSGVAIDYAFAFERPVIFVDMPRKIRNQDFHLYELPTVEDAIRSRIGVVVPQEIYRIVSAVEQALEENEQCGPTATQFDEFIFNIGSSAEIGAKALMRLGKESRAAGK